MRCDILCSCGISLVCGRRESTALQYTPQGCTDGHWYGVALSSSCTLAGRCTCSLCGAIHSSARTYYLGLHFWMVRLVTTLPPP